MPCDHLQDQEQMLSLRRCLVDAGRMLFFMVEQVFLLMGYGWPTHLQMHKAQCREERAKGQRKNCVHIFLVLLLNMNFVSHFVALFCLTCCFHLYIPGKLVMFLDLGEVTLCRICPLCPSHSLLSGPQSSVLRGCPLCVLQGYSCCGELTTTGSLVSVADPCQVDCLVLPYAQAAGPSWVGQVMRLLTEGS